MERFQVIRGEEVVEDFRSRSSAISRAEGFSSDYPEFEWKVLDTSTGRIIYPTP